MRLNLTQDIFKLPIIPDHTLSISFDSTIVEDSVGREYINPKNIQPQFKIEFSDIVIKPTDVEEIVSFYRSMEGNGKGFFFQLPFHNYVDNTSTTYSDTSIQGVMKRITATKYYLAIRYKIGSYYTDKIIWKTDLNYSIFKNAALVSSNNYTFDDATGIVEFETAIDESDSLTWQGNYYIPVRFEGDLETEEIVKDNWYRINNLVLQEIMLPSMERTVNKNLEFGDLSVEFKPFDSGTTTVENFKTDISTSWIGFENRKQYYQLSRRTYMYNASTYKETEMYYILIFFVVAKGKYRSFIFRDELVRFNSDSLAISLIVSSEYNPYELDDLISFYDINSYSIISVKQ